MTQPPDDSAPRRTHTGAGRSPERDNRPGKLQRNHVDPHRDWQLGDEGDEPE